MQNATYISEYLDGMRQITETISREAIDDVIEALFDVYRRGGAIWICGNGGSASTATHFACDLTKATIRPGKPRVKASGSGRQHPHSSAT